MYPIQHYRRGEELMKQAETANDPSRLIGLAQAHFLAAQTGLQAAHSIGLTDDPRAFVREWEEAFGRTVEIDPEGRIVR